MTLIAEIAKMQKSITATPIPKQEIENSWSTMNYSIMAVKKGSKSSEANTQEKLTKMLAKKEVDKADILHIMTGLYSLYTSPGAKERYLESKEERTDVSEAIQSTKGYNKEGKREARLDATYAKLKMDFNASELSWCTVLNGFASQCLDNLMTAVLPENPSLIYSKGFWGCLGWDQAIDLFNNLTKTAYDNLDSIMSNPTEFAASKQKWNAEVMNLLRSSSEATYSYVSNNSDLNVYKYCKLHIPNPLFLRLSFQFKTATGVTQTNMQKEFEMILGKFISKWATKDYSLSVINRETVKEFIGKVMKPINTTMSALRTPLFYSNLEATSAKEFKTIKKALALGVTLQGGSATDALGMYASTISSINKIPAK